MLVSMGQKNTYALVYNNDQSLVVKKKSFAGYGYFPFTAKNSRIKLPVQAWVRLPSCKQRAGAPPKNATSRSMVKSHIKPVLMNFPIYPLIIQTSS